MTIELNPAQTLQQLLCSEMNRFSRRSLLSFIHLGGAPVAVSLGNAPSIAAHLSLLGRGSSAGVGRGGGRGDGRQLYFSKILGGRLGLCWNKCGGLAANCMPARRNYLFMNRLHRIIYWVHWEKRLLNNGNTKRRSCTNDATSDNTCLKASNRMEEYDKNANATISKVVPNRNNWSVPEIIDKNKYAAA